MGGSLAALASLQERADSRASNCVGGLFVCVCGVVRFLGFYNGFMAFLGNFENV